MINAGELQIFISGAMAVAEKSDYAFGPGSQINTMSDELKAAVMKELGMNEDTLAEELPRLDIMHEFDAEVHAAYTRLKDHCDHLFGEEQVEQAIVRVRDWLDLAQGPGGQVTHFPPLKVFEGRPGC